MKVRCIKESPFFFGELSEIYEVVEEGFDWWKLKEHNKRVLKSRFEIVEEKTTPESYNYLIKILKKYNIK